MSTLTIIPNMKLNNEATQSARTAQSLYSSAAASLKMTGQQLQYLLLAVGLLSLGTMVLTYPM